MELERVATGGGEGGLAGTGSGGDKQTSLPPPAPSPTQPPTHPPTPHKCILPPALQVRLLAQCQHKVPSHSKRTLAAHPCSGIVGRLLAQHAPQSPHAPLPFSAPLRRYCGCGFWRSTSTRSPGIVSTLSSPSPSNTRRAPSREPRLHVGGGCGQLWRLWEVGDNAGGVRVCRTATWPPSPQYPFTVPLHLPHPPRSTHRITACTCLVDRKAAPSGRTRLRSTATVFVQPALSLLRETYSYR